MQTNVPSSTSRVVLRKQQYMESRNSVNTRHDSTNPRSSAPPDVWTRTRPVLSTANRILEDDVEIEKEPIVLDFDIRMRSILAIFIHYSIALLWTAVIAVLVCIPIFAFPMTKFQMFFTVKQGYNGNAYVEDVLENTTGSVFVSRGDAASVAEVLKHYATYAPCTVFKQIGCPYIMEDSQNSSSGTNITNWVLNDMIATMSLNLRLLVMSGAPFNISTCHYLTYNNNHSNTLLGDASPYLNDSIVLRVNGFNNSESSLYEMLGQAPLIFMEYNLKCTTDEYVLPMLNFTMYYYNNTDGGVNDNTEILSLIEDYRSEASGSSGSLSQSAFEESFHQLANPDKDISYHANVYSSTCAASVINICINVRNSSSSGVFYYVYGVTEGVLWPCHTENGGGGNNNDRPPRESSSDSGSDSNTASDQVSPTNSIVILNCQETFYEPFASRFASTNYRISFLTTQFSATAIIANMDTIKLNDENVTVVDNTKKDSSDALRYKRNYFAQAIPLSGVFSFVVLGFIVIMFILCVALCLIIPSQRIEMMTVKNQIEADASIAAEVLDRQERMVEAERERRLWQTYRNNNNNNNANEAETDRPSDDSTRNHTAMGERIVNDNELYTMTSYQTASYFPNHNNYNNERRAIAPSDTVTGTSTLHTVNSDLDILSNNDNNNDVRPTAPSIGSSISPGISGNGSFREYAHHSSNNNNGNILEEEEMRTMTLIESSTSPTRRNNDSHIVEIDDYYNHDYNEAMNAIEDTNHTRGTNRNSAVTVRTGRQDTNVAGGPSDVFVNSTSDNSSPLVQSSLPFSRLLYTEQVKIRKRNKRIRKSSVGSPESSPTNRAEDPDKYIKGKKKRIKTFHQLNADEQVLLAFSRLNMMDYLNSYDGDYYYQKVKHTRDKTLLQEEELDHLCHVMAGLPSILDAYRVEGGHRIGQIPKLTSGGIGFISNLKFVRFRRAQVALDHSLNILFRVAIILCFVFFVMSFSFHLTGTGDPLTISNPSIEMYRYISDSRVERVEFREEDYFISRLEDRNGTFFSIFDQTNPPNSITHLPGVQNVFQVVGINSNDGSGSTIYGEMYRTVPVRYVIISSFCLVLALGFIWYHDYGILRKRMW